MEKEICILKNFRNILDATTDTDCIDLDNAIKTIEYAMKPKTCDGCKHSKVTISSVICGKNGTYKEADDYCKYFMPKDNA